MVEVAAKLVERFRNCLNWCVTDQEEEGRVSGGEFIADVLNKSVKRIYQLR